MGNCEACLTSKAVHNSNEEEQVEEMVRVVRTTDNELFEFPGPVIVKDLLFGFQGFAVYPNLYKAQRPLHPDTLLKLSHLYYLKPLVDPSSAPACPDDTKSKQSSTWARPALMKPFVSTGMYSLVFKSEKDLLLAQQNTDMSSGEPSVNGPAEGLFTHNRALLKTASRDLLACKTQEMLAGDLNAQEKEGQHTTNTQEGSFRKHAEALITVNSQAVQALSEASLSSNAHDIASMNDLAEGVFTTSKAQEEPSSFDRLPIDHQLTPSQAMKGRRVRFSDEVEVIPSSGYELTDSASTTPSCSQRSDYTVETSVHGPGEEIGQLDEQVGMYSPTKEEVSIPHMSKKELMNGVVRVKVVISKKQLAELMAARTSGDKQSDALMAKMLAPLLSPTSSCPKPDDSFLKGSSASPSWRPSLHHIPENHSLNDLF